MTSFNYYVLRFRIGIGIGLWNTKRSRSYQCQTPYDLGLLSMCRSILQFCFDADSDVDSTTRDGDEGRVNRYSIGTYYQTWYRISSIRC
jgi:hypothetical protein